MYFCHRQSEPSLLAHALTTHAQSLCRGVCAVKSESSQSLLMPQSGVCSIFTFTVIDPCALGSQTRAENFLRMAETNLRRFSCTTSLDSSARRMLSCAGVSERVCMDVVDSVSGS